MPNRVKRKRDARLAARREGYQAANSGSRFAKVSDSPNRNQVMHLPGSQNRKK